MDVNSPIGLINLEPTSKGRHTKYIYKVIFEGQGRRLLTKDNMSGMIYAYKIYNDETGVYIKIKGKRSYSTEWETHLRHIAEDYVKINRNYRRKYRGEYVE